MFAVGNAGGPRGEAVGRIATDPETLRRTRERLIARLVRKGISYRDIARLLNVGSHQQVMRIYQATPEDVRRDPMKSPIFD